MFMPCSFIPVEGVFCLAANKVAFETCSQSLRRRGCGTSFVSTFATGASAWRDVLREFSYNEPSEGMLIFGGRGCPPCPLGVAETKRCSRQFQDSSSFTFNTYLLILCKALGTFHDLCLSSAQLYLWSCGRSCRRRSFGFELLEKHLIEFTFLPTANTFGFHQLVFSSKPLPTFNFYPPFFLIFYLFSIKKSPLRLPPICVSSTLALSS